MAQKWYTILTRSCITSSEFLSLNDQIVPKGQMNQNIQLVAKKFHMRKMQVNTDKRNSFKSKYHHTFAFTFTKSSLQILKAYT